MLSTPLRRRSEEEGGQLEVEDRAPLLGLGIDSAKLEAGTGNGHLSVRDSLPQQNTVNGQNSFENLYSQLPLMSTTSCTSAPNDSWLDGDYYSRPGRGADWDSPSGNRVAPTASTLPPFIWQPTGKERTFGQGQKGAGVTQGSHLKKMKQVLAQNEASPLSRHQAA